MKTMTMMFNTRLRLEDDQSDGPLRLIEGMKSMTKMRLSLVAE